MEIPEFGISALVASTNNNLSNDIAPTSNFTSPFYHRYPKDVGKTVEKETWA
jgi:hypothetical protein